MGSEENRYCRLLDHTADLGMEIFGPDAEALFANAAKALSNMVAGLAGEPSRSSHRHSIVVEGADWADLLVNWLRELLYLWNGRQEIVHNVHVQALSETRLQAEVKTVDFKASEDEIYNEIKAVTYHQVEVASDEKGWRARIIFDV